MARLLPVPSAVLLLLLPLPLLAATIHVPSQEPTIQAGIDAVSPCAPGGSECGIWYRVWNLRAAGEELGGDQGDVSVMDALSCGR